jgi:hypothetical protein
MTVANDPAHPAPQGPQTSTDITSTPPAPVSSTAIQAGPPEPEPSIPLPPLSVPPPRQTTPEELANEIRRLDWGMGLMVLVLAFLLASFAARNSDLWQHLAMGRLYAHGHFNFGVDPFTYTAGSTYWVNHSWLLDFILYGLTTLVGGADTSVGGAILIVLKALLVLALAWCMLSTRRPAQSLWAPAACTGLALVVMSPRLLLQPTLVSMLFLALTVYILQRPRYEETGHGPAKRSGWSPLAVYWWLPVLFLLWVNVDSWFFLGPLTVALFLIGQLLQQVFSPIRTGPDAPEPAQLRRLGLVLIVGLAACLINPHHYKAFALPAPLYTTTPAEVFDRDSMLRIFFLSPFEDDYFQPGTGWSVAGMAYFVLLGLGLLSFALSYFNGWRWWRLLVWLAFAVLSAYQLRNIGFFAVVAGPITALNLQDFAAGRFGLVPRVQPVWKTWSLLGRGATLAVGLVLLLAAWPGWLHARPMDTRQSHRVAWRVEADPSLRKAAEQLNAWHAQGLLGPEDRAFNYSPDVANYCAWYCADVQGVPREPGFFDFRLNAVPPDVATQYVDVRQALKTETGPVGTALQRPTNWQEMFRKHHINHVILNRYDFVDFSSVWPSLLLDWDQWALVYIDGKTCIFRWNDPRKRAAGPKVPRLDPNTLAFGPRSTPLLVEGPDHAPQLQDIWTRFLHGPPAVPLAQEEAERYLDYFSIIGSRWKLPWSFGSNSSLWVGLGGLNAALPSWAGTVAIPVQMFNPVGGLAANDKDQGPPAALVLAVRAARRAIQDSPDYSGSYFTLALSYFTLWQKQEEHWSRPIGAQEMLPRQRLRQIQITAALERGLKLRPDFEEGHQMLYQVYGQTRYVDLAVDHLREYVKLLSPKLGEKPEVFKARADGWEQQLKKLETYVNQQRNEYENVQRDQPLLRKVQIALSRDLGGKALDLLLNADEMEIQGPEASLQLFLLLTTGRLEDVRERLTPEFKSTLGLNYEWYQTLLEAASGNYTMANKYLDEAIANAEKAAVQNVLLLVQMQSFAGSGVGNLQGVNYWLERLRQAADYRVLRGLLTLEEGDTATAARYFQEALDTNNKKPFDFESRMIADHYLKLIHEAGGG